MDIRKPEGGEAIVKLSVENSGLTSKLISYAALTVSPESASLADAIDDLLGQQPLSITKERSDKIPYCVCFITQAINLVM